MRAAYNQSMKRIVLLLMVFSLLSSCGAFRSKRSMRSRISEYVEGKEKLMEHSTTGLTVGSVCYVHLSHNPGSGYSWYYTVSTNTAAVLESAGSRVFRSSYEGNQTGVPVDTVWLFRAIGKGPARIEFLKYRSWRGKKSAVSRKIYKIIVE